MLSLSPEALRPCEFFGHSRPISGRVISMRWKRSNGPYPPLMGTGGNARKISILLLFPRLGVDIACGIRWAFVVIWKRNTPESGGRCSLDRWQTHSSSDIGWQTILPSITHRHPPQNGKEGKKEEKRSNYRGGTRSSSDIGWQTTCR